MDTERLEIKVKGDYKKQQNQNSIINKILYLQIINLFLIILNLFYQNNKNKQIISEEKYQRLNFRKDKIFKNISKQ